jgi:hypothetical protein
MRRLLSITGWNPQVFQRELVPGDYVAFKMLNSDILRVGVVIETSDGKSPTAIKCLTNDKVYYPYSQDTLLFNDECKAKGLTSKIVEIS